jgi:hypothetical protein
MTYLDIVARIESLQIKLLIRFGCPEPEIDCVDGAISRDRVVMGYGSDTLPSIPPTHALQIKAQRNC